MKLRNIAAGMRHLRAGRVAVAVGNVIACSGLVAFIACSDSSITEPAAPKTAVAARPSMSGAPANWWSPPPAVTHGDTTINTFTVDPTAGGSPSFGSLNKSRIVIPASAICNPATSGYGAAYWTKPCAPATTNITFTVRSWIGRDGMPKVAFSPDLRFVPTQTVLLYISTAGTATGPASVVQWCTSSMTGCVNEAATDPTVTATFDPFAYSVWRRVKHLSGYNVIPGRTSPASAP